MKPFLAMITPVASGAHPDHELPKPPATPGAPDQTLPGALPKPEHPIYYPLPPGAPVDPEYGVPDTKPDQGLPKPPAAPTHPIVLPPDTGGGWGPIYIWGGGPGARPPIAIPPEGETDDGAKIEFKAAWTPDTGWVTVGIVVPGGEHVTPSKKK
jgi:hypothetical protein